MKISEKLIASLTNFLITRFEPYYNLFALRNVWCVRKTGREDEDESVDAKMSRIKKRKEGEMENWHKDKERRRWSLRRG